MPALTDTHSVHRSPCCINAQLIEVAYRELPLLAATRAQSKSQIICPNLPRGEAYTQTDYNHGCCFTDKRSILPWLRGVFTSDFNVWKHHRKLGVVFRTNIICVMCVTKQGRKKMRMWFPMLTGARPITCH